jgi:hypothetical protein
MYRATLLSIAFSQQAILFLLYARGMPEKDGKP